MRGARCGAVRLTGAGVAATVAGLAVAVAACAWAAPNEIELFTNGDFEEGIAGWQPLDQSRKCRFEPDTKVKQSGTQSLRITKSGPGDEDFVKQSAQLPSGAKEVRAACWFKVEKGARAAVTVYFFNAKGDTIGKGDLSLVNSGATKKFEKAEERFEVPKGATGVGVNVRMTAPGTIWVDGFEIACADASGGAAAATPGSIVNGGFESQLDGWRTLAFGSETATTKADATVKCEGKASLRVDRTSPRLQREDGLWTGVAGGRELGLQRLRFQVRTEGDARASAVVQALDADDLCIATLRGAAPAAARGAFVPVEIAVEPPAGSRRLVISLVVTGAGTAWFDDLVLEPAK